MILAPAPTAPPVTEQTDHLTHIYCVRHGVHDTALCGSPRNKPESAMRVIGRKYPITPNLCIVCLSMQAKKCPQCGE